MTCMVITLPIMNVIGGRSIESLSKVFCSACCAIFFWERKTKKTFQWANPYARFAKSMCSVFQSMCSVLQNWVHGLQNWGYGLANQNVQIAEFGVRITKRRVGLRIFFFHLECSIHCNIVAAKNVKDSLRGKYMAYFTKIRPFDGKSFWVVHHWR